MSTRSGFSRDALAIASATVVATPSTLMSGYSASSDERPSNMRRWSSTKRRLIFPGISDFLGQRLAVRGRRLGVERQPELDHGATAGRAPDQPPAARDLRALSHRDQTEVPRLRIGDLDVETLAVVLDADPAARPDGAKLDVDGGSGGVLLDVDQRLLGDPVDGRADAADRFAVEVVLQREREMRLLVQPLQQLAQRRGQAGAIERGGAEVEHQAAQARNRVADRLFEPGEELDLTGLGEVPAQLLH